MKIQNIELAFVTFDAQDVIVTSGFLYMTGGTISYTTDNVTTMILGFPVDRNTTYMQSDVVESGYYITGIDSIDKDGKTFTFSYAALPTDGKVYEAVDITSFEHGLGDVVAWLLDYSDGFKPKQ